MRASYLAVLALLGVAPFGVQGPDAAMAAEKSAATVQKGSMIGLRLSAAQPEGGRFSDRPIPAELLVPVAHFPCEMAAPSAAEWVTFPAQLAPSETLSSWRQASLDPKVMTGPTDRSPPVAQKAAGEPDARAKASVPLPPRRPATLTAAVQDEPVEETLPAQPAPEEGPAAAPPDLSPAPANRRITADRPPPAIEALVLRHSERFRVPAGLVRRVAWRESKFDPKQRNGPYWGLMQIRVDTARGLGFRGAPSELLDADTNMTYAVAYLANAYRVAGRNERRAEALYRKGYYYEAKRKGMLSSLIKTASADE